MPQHGRTVSMTEQKGQPSWRDASSHWSGSGSSQSHKGPNSHSSDSTDSGYGHLPTTFCGRSSGNYGKMKRQDYEDLEKLALNYFEKKFCFSPSLCNWTLPEPNKMFLADKWKVSEKE
jgi:hypothetical protein